MNVKEKEEYIEAVGELEDIKTLEIVKNITNSQDEIRKTKKNIIKIEEDQERESERIIKEFGADIYSLRYKYGYNWGCYQNLAIHLIKMMVENKEMNKKFIDIGCGVGWFSDMLYFNVSRDIKGIDFSKLAILFHARRLYPAIEFEIVDIYDYDYAGCEVAIITEVLEHIDGDIELLDKLPKGCTVYATVPFEKERQDVTHVREYSIDSVTKKYGRLMKFKTVEKFEQYIVICGVIK